MIRNVDVAALSPEGLLDREWLVTNGLGGFASGTVLGPPTRSQHGLLVAALPAPLGRTLMVDGLSEHFEAPDGRAYDRSDALGPREAPLPRAPEAFWLDMGLPVWRLRFDEWLIEKTVVMPHLQNTTIVVYRLIEGPGPLSLKLRPWMAVAGPGAAPRLNALSGDQFELSDREHVPPLRARTVGALGEATLALSEVADHRYRIEEERGGPLHGGRRSPGWFPALLSPDAPLALVLSVEPWPVLLALDPLATIERERERRRGLLERAPESLRAGPAAELVLAADQFLVVPPRELAGSSAPPFSVIAGYPWFTDWGRDTMISLEGLALAIGRPQEAGRVLTTFARHVRDGLVPNFFPGGERRGGLPHGRRLALVLPRRRPLSGHHGGRLGISGALARALGDRDGAS